jgi:hypothetical protein
MLRALLDHADFDGRDALLAQIDDAQVVGHCPCGCATVDLKVSGQPTSHAGYGPIPNEADVLGADGGTIGGVLAFVKDGRLSMLEVYSFTDEPINPLPPLSQLNIYQLPVR